MTMYNFMVHLSNIWVLRDVRQLRAVTHEIMSDRSQNQTYVSNLLFKQEPTR